MAYIIDSDVSMQASNMHYQFDICPAFWDWMDRANARGILFSIDRVMAEILAGHGDLISWVNSRPGFFVNSADYKTYESLKLLGRWAADNYKADAYRKFFECADLVIVGYAHAHGHVVVTQEKYSNGEQVKIPNACKKMSVECINTWQMLQKEGVKFVLP